MEKLLKNEVLGSGLPLFDITFLEEQEKQNGI
jgi:hypothetical protein